MISGIKITYRSNISQAKSKLRGQLRRAGACRRQEQKVVRAMERLDQKLRRLGQ